MRCHTVDRVPGNPAAHYERRYSRQSTPLGVESTAHLAHSCPRSPAECNNSLFTPRNWLPSSRVSILLKLHLLDCRPLSSIRFTLLTFAALRSVTHFFLLQPPSPRWSVRIETARSFSSPVLLRPSLRNSPSKHTRLALFQPPGSQFVPISAGSIVQEAPSLFRTYHPCELTTRRRCTRTNVSLAKLSPSVPSTLRIASAA